MASNFKGESPVINPYGNDLGIAEGSGAADVYI